MSNSDQNNHSLRERLHGIIFHADSPAGKAFDVVLLWAILLSIVVVSLESVASIRAQFGWEFRAIEWVLTILFTIEYMLRVACVKKPSKYIFSFYGIVDLLAVLPTYLGLFFADTHYLIVIRILRLLRVFRVFKLVRYLGEARVLMDALRASRPKIVVFLGGVFSLVVIVGTVMHVLEGPESGFTSIPKSIYWAIVTVTTVGYGDITPHTPIGQAISALLMIVGYGIIAVPTGIVSAELTRLPRSVATHACTECGRDLHDPDASFCKYCGGKLKDP